MRSDYDVIVIGGGHAGIEAAWAAAAALRAEDHRRDACATEGGTVALITMDPARIGQMSCNPAIGGLAKGQMVREIDALGGVMGRAIDATGIMFKMLNTSKGAAVRGPRAQADKYAYAAETQRLIASRSNIDVIAGTVDEFIVEGDAIAGVRVPAGSGVVRANQSIIERNLPGDRRAEAIYPSRPVERDRCAESREIRSRAVVLTTGTFMRGLMHTGEAKTRGGRVGEDSAQGISSTLRGLGFELGRLKTGTPPRLARESIEWDVLDRQSGDESPVPFSDQSPDVMPAGRFPHLLQTECRLTRTCAESHALIRDNLHRAPMFSGQIDAECGPRYCPSIEDKVVRFPQRESHHVFLEPESLHTNEIYCNGISTSLPIDVQERIVRSMPGCANAEILRWGYAVEYDMVWPHQIDATCETKRIRGLFFAGQINCTTGYEEAGAQGLIAGINAAQLARGEELIRFGRDEGYLGVMMDDLVTKTPREPYRMFTSRAEHRLLLRADNADERLTPIARESGLIDDAHWRSFTNRRDALDRIRTLFDSIYQSGRTLREIARRPDACVDRIRSLLPEAFDDRLLERVITEAKYDGYISRQRAQINRASGTERMHIPVELDPRSIPGLRSEAREALARFRPATVGQAGRLAGINPADLTVLAVAIRRFDQREERATVGAST